MYVCSIPGHLPLVRLYLDNFIKLTAHSLNLSRMAELGCHFQAEMRMSKLHCLQGLSRTDFYLLFAYLLHASNFQVPNNVVYTVYA